LRSAARGGALQVKSDAIIVEGSPLKKAETLRSSVRRELGLGRPARPSVRILALAGLLWTPLAAAQPPYRQEILPGVSSLAVVDPRARPRLVDLDGDGDAELAVGGWSGRLHYFERLPGPGLGFVGIARSANPFAGIDVGSTANPDFADLDGDGDIDFVTSGSGTLHYFENTGSSSAPAFAGRIGGDNPFDGITNAGDGPALGDLDGDGDLDLVTDGTDLRYFRNVGNASAAAFLELTGAANPFAAATISTSPALGDLDGDGDLDLAGGQSVGKVAYLRNTGTSAAPAFALVTGAASPFAAVLMPDQVRPELADLDGDGDFDALLGNDEGGFDTVYNTGSAAVPAFVAAGAADPLASFDIGQIPLRPDFIDLDADGDPDMIAANANREARFFLNTGSEAQPAFVEQKGSADPFATMGQMPSETVLDFADLDGDGDFDAVSGSGPDLGGVAHRRNNGSSSAPFFGGPSGGNVFGTPVGWMYTRASPEFGDMDGDGDFDVVIGLTNNPVKYFENTGTTSAPMLVERSGSGNPFGAIGVPHETFPEVVDFDRDGDFDLLYNGVESMEGLENMGGSLFVQISGGANPFIDVGPGVGGMMDIDGDTDFDFLLGTDGGRLIFYRSSAVLFYDGFESGDTGSWSTALP
jgi:hypothetical protein